MKLFNHLDETVRLSDDERILLDAVRALCRDKIAPRAAAYDRTGDFPWDNIEDINALGLNAMFIPEEYGGADMSYAAYLACVREISKACASTGIIWATNFHAMKPVNDFGTEEQKKEYIPKHKHEIRGEFVRRSRSRGSSQLLAATARTPFLDVLLTSSLWWSFLGSPFSFLQ